MIHPNYRFFRKPTFPAPEDIFAGEGDTAARHEQEVRSPAIDSAIAAWYDAKDQGDGVGLRTAAKALVDATSAAFRVQGVPTFAHPVLPPQFVMAEVDELRRLPKDHRDSVVGAILETLEPGAKRAAAQQFGHLLMQPESQFADSTDNAATDHEVTPVAYQAEATPRPSARDARANVALGPTSVRPPHWERNNPPRRPKEGEWRKIAEVRVPGEGQSDWMPVATNIPNGEIRFVVRPAEDIPLPSGETHEGPRPDAWVGRTPPPRYRFQRQPGPRSVGVPAPTGHAGWVQFRIRPDNAGSDIEGESGAVPYGGKPWTTDLRLRRRRGGANSGATVLVKPAGEFGTLRSVIVEIWVRWA